MAEATKKKKSNKEIALERYRSRYPDADPADEEAMYGHMNEDYDRYEADLKKANATSDKLNELLDSDPRSAAFLTAWHDGKNPVLAFIDEYGEDVMSDIQNPANRAKIEASTKAFMAKAAKAKELDAEYDKNIEASRNLYQQMIEEGTYSQEQIDKGLDLLEQVFNDFLVGKVTREGIEAMIKSTSYDEAVDEAGAEGEIRGRNAQIQTKRRNALRGDGLPQGGGGGGKGKPKMQDDDPSLGALNRYGANRRSIWDAD